MGTSLTSLTIPASVTSIGKTIFGKEHGFDGYYFANHISHLYVDPGNKVYDSRDNCNAIIETATNILLNGSCNTVIPNTVTSIEEYAFRCTDLTRITIPGNVNSIGSYAFLGCESLNEVTIKNGVKSIGQDAFSYCLVLTSVSIPNSVTSIGDRAFVSCTGLTDITIPYSVVSIGKRTFMECSSLSSIRVDAGNPVYDSRNNCSAIIETQTNTLISGCKNTVIPDGVVSIGEYAFYYSTSLVSITIPDSVTNIDEYAFGHCTGLVRITVPDSVTNIGQSAFGYCTSLTSVTLSNNVTNIDSIVFANCTSLANIVIPASVTSIGSSAFSGCSSLTSIVIPDSVTNIGRYAFEECTGLTSITLSNSVTNIGYFVFSSCTSLANIVIPASVTNIDLWAFNGCSSLTSIMFLGTVDDIDDRSFYGCNSLEDAFFCGDAPKIGMVTDNLFADVNKDIFKIHYIAGKAGWTDNPNIYFEEKGTWCGYKLVLWDGQFVQIQQADRQSITLQVQNHEEAYVYAAIYEDGRLIKVVCKSVKANAGEVQLTFGLDELPEGAVVKAFVLAADGKTPLAKNAVWTVR